MNRLKDIALILFGGLLLCNVAFTNGFPLLYPDTGTYLASGFKGFVPEDRPIFYGLFARHVSLSETPWLIVFAQGILLSTTLFLFCKKFINQKPFRPYFLGLMGLVSLFTAASLYASLLIPDVFTPILMVATTVFLFAEKLSIVEKITLSIIIALSVMTHNSNSLVLYLSLFFLTVEYVYKKGWKDVGKNWMRNRMLALAGLCVLIYLLSASINYSYNKSFSVSKGGHVFVMSRLMELGIAQKYLDENCVDKNYKICAYKDNIPFDFIWDFQNSPLYKTGGWEANKLEYNAIIQDILLTPKHLKKVVANFAGSTAQQFFCFELFKNSQQTGDSPGVGRVTEYFDEHIRDYYTSKQNRSTLDFTTISFIQNVLVIASLMYLVFSFAINKIVIDNRIKRIAVFLMVAIIANAFVCSSFSTVDARYQGRVAWLVILAAALVFVNKSTELKKEG